MDQVEDEGADLNEEETAEEAPPTPNVVTSKASKPVDAEAKRRDDEDKDEKDVESPAPPPPIAPAATVAAKAAEAGVAAGAKAEAEEADVEAPKTFSPSQQQNLAAGDAEEVKGVDLEINTPEEERGA